MENDKIKFRLVFKQLFERNEMVRMSYFAIGVTTFMESIRLFSR